MCGLSHDYRRFRLLDGELRRHRQAPTDGKREAHRHQHRACDGLGHRRQLRRQHRAHRSLRSQQLGEGLPRSSNLSQLSCTQQRKRRRRGERVRRNLGSAARRATRPFGRRPRGLREKWFVHSEENAVTRPFVKPPKPRSANRRAFLRAVGISATALPFYQLLEDSFAHAAGDPLPLKLIVISHPHGIAYEYFSMRTPDNPDIAVEGLSTRGTDTETNFDIAYPNCVLQPFDDAATYGKSFKDRLLTIEGLDLASDGHDAVASILTGSPLTGGLPANSSLDQFLSVEAGLGATTRKSNVVLGVGDPNPHPGNTLSYSAG